MESSSSSSSSMISFWDILILYFLRPILAISFVFFMLFLGWFLAWKLVLVHVPLVQEIFGLRKKTVIPKPPSRRRISRFYNTLNSRNSDSLWSVSDLPQPENTHSAPLKEKETLVTHRGEKILEAGGY